MVRRHHFSISISEQGIKNYICQIQPAAKEDAVLSVSLPGKDCGQGIALKGMFRELIIPNVRWSMPNTGVFQNCS